jgi:predicted RNA polymerase sigma factor
VTGGPGPGGPVTDGPGGVEDLLRAPQVLGALVRRYGQFHLREDASQEALLAAACGGRPKGRPRTRAAG